MGTDDNLYRLNALVFDDNVNLCPAGDSCVWLRKVKVVSVPQCSLNARNANAHLVWMEVR